jgi:O-antigen/teichoic acid export membrane protein
MLTSKTLLVLTGLITAGLINRSLGPEGRGIFAEMQTWVVLFMVVFGISIDTVIYHFSNKSLHGDNDAEKFMTIFLLNVFYALLAVVAMTFFVFFWPSQVSLETKQSIFLLDIFLIFFMLSSNLTVFFQSLGKIKFSAIIGIVQALVNVGVIGTGYLFGFININFVVISMIIVQAISLGIIFLLSMKLKFVFGHFSKKLAASLIKAGLKFHIATISAFIYTRINQIIVFKYCGAYEAGIFAVSLTLAISVMFIPGTFQIALYPRVIHSNDDYEVTLKSLRLGFYVWGIAVIAIVLLAKPILLIYSGKSFLESVNVFRVLMIGTWALPLSSLIAPYCVKKGIFSLLSFSAAGLGILSIGLNLLLVPNYKSMGAAIATSLTCVIGFLGGIILLWVVSKKNPFGFIKPVFKKYA